jgi:hypothetical protein
MTKSDNGKVYKVIDEILSKDSLEVSDYKKFIETKKKYGLNLNDVMGDEIAWTMETFERRLSEIAEKEGGYDTWFDSDEWDS